MGRAEDEALGTRETARSADVGVGEGGVSLRQPLFTRAFAQHDELQGVPVAAGVRDGVVGDEGLFRLPPLLLDGEVVLAAGLVYSLMESQSCLWNSPMRSVGILA
ncbi:hypothetical protein ACKKBG_A11740 [Auxenochlorella protothecoides x Auxenochlorella symbiontica]